MTSESTNADFAASDRRFRAACDEENVEPTKRQASKWRRGTGRAFKNRHPNQIKLHNQKRDLERELYAASTTPTEVEHEDGSKTMDGPPDQGRIDRLQNGIASLVRRIEAMG